MLRAYFLLLAMLAISVAALAQVSISVNFGPPALPVAFDNLIWPTLIISFGPPSIV
jgi:hypothetical protein